MTDGATPEPDLTLTDALHDDADSATHFSEGALVGAIAGVAPGLILGHFVPILAIAIAIGLTVGALVPKR